MNKFYVKDAGPKGNGLYALCDINEGELIFNFIGNFVPLGNGSALSLQVDDSTALESTEFFDDNLNHSCDPNCKVAMEGKNVFLSALRNIKTDEELSFNYNTTEYNMFVQGSHFQCSCGSEKCLGEIKGFVFLTDEQRQSIKNILLPYLAKKLS